MAFANDFIVSVVSHDPESQSLRFQEHNVNNRRTIYYNEDKSTCNVIFNNESQFPALVKSVIIDKHDSNVSKVHRQKPIKLHPKQQQVQSITLSHDGESQQSTDLEKLTLKVEFFPEVPQESLNFNYRGTLAKYTSYDLELLIDAAADVIDNNNNFCYYQNFTTEKISKIQNKNVRMYGQYLVFNGVDNQLMIQLTKALASLIKQQQYLKIGSQDGYQLQEYKLSDEQYKQLVDTYKTILQAPTTIEIDFDLCHTKTDAEVDKLFSNIKTIDDDIWNKQPNDSLLPENDTSEYITLPKSVIDEVDLLVGEEEKLNTLLNEINKTKQQFAIDTIKKVKAGLLFSDVLLPTVEIQKILLTPQLKAIIKQFEQFEIPINRGKQNNNRKNKQDKLTKDYDDYFTCPLTGEITIERIVHDDTPRQLLKNSVVDVSARQPKDNIDRLNVSQTPPTTKPQAIIIGGKFSSVIINHQQFKVPLDAKIQITQDKLIIDSVGINITLTDYVLISKD